MGTQRFCQTPAGVTESREKWGLPVVIASGSLRTAVIVAASVRGLVRGGGGAIIVAVHALLVRLHVLGEVLSVHFHLFGHFTYQKIFHKLFARIPEEALNNWPSLNYFGAPSKYRQRLHGN